MALHFTSAFFRKLVLSLLLVLCHLVAAQAAPGEYVVRFHFRLDYAAYEKGYMGNEQIADSLARFLGSIPEGQILDATVTAYASPESSLQYNNELCEIRLGTMKKLIESRFPQLEGKTSYKLGGEAWDMVSSRVKADASLKKRSPETYRIITGILDDDTISTDQKKVLLQSRLKENWYGYLRWIHYREVRICELRVRYGEAVVPQPKPKPEPKTEPATFVPVARVPQPVILHDTVYMTRTDTVYITRTKTFFMHRTDTVYVTQNEAKRVVPAVVEETKAETKADSLARPVLGMSTNILYDAAITPNVAFEIPMGKHWSLLVDYTFPWWVNRQNDRAWEIQKLDLGLRYWLGRRRDAQHPYNQLTGHFFGVDTGLGYYDIEPRHTGYQGEFLTAGLEYGYAWRLGEHWRMSAFVAAGWMGTRYRNYKGNEDDAHLLYQYDGRFIWWGPTKVGLSFQYIFISRKKRAK